MHTTHQSDMFRNELEKKDALIEALTQQLEGTAEKLDRLQRTGTSGGSKEFGLSTQLTNQLRSAMSDFEEVSVLDHFERIEVGIEQILELLSGEVSNLEVPQSRDLTDNHQQPAKPLSTVPLKVDDDDFWAVTKARLMQAGIDPQGEAPAVKGPVPDSAPEIRVPAATESASLGHNSSGELTLGQTVNGKITIPPPPENLPDFPRPVEEIDNVVLLEEAVSERDSFISQLVARLRRAESYPFPPVDWKQLSNVPEDLEYALSSLKRQLEDHLRQSELAISLERASLTRERAKLRQVKQHLANEIQRMGSEDQNDSSTPDAYRRTMEERLSRMLAPRKS